METKIFNQFEINAIITNVPRGRCLKIFQEAIRLYNEKYEDTMTEEENDELMEFWSSIMQSLISGSLIDDFSS